VPLVNLGIGELKVLRLEHLLNILLPVVKLGNGMLNVVSLEQESNISSPLVKLDKSEQEKVVRLEQHQNISEPSIRELISLTVNDTRLSVPWNICVPYFKLDKLEENIVMSEPAQNKSYPHIILEVS
jgi:hypothetical protein